MSDANEPNAQPTPPDNSPEAWAAAENPVEEVIAEESAADDEGGAPPLDPNKEPEAAAEPEPEDDDPPPEFWSKERKAEWKKITDPAIRAAIRDHYDEATRATSAKIEEAAKARKDAEAKAIEFERERAQSVAWWQQAGPAIAQALQGKWAHFTSEYRAQLAEDNPAQSVKEEAAFRIDQEKFAELSQRQAREVAAVAQRAKEAHQAERAAEHQKLAAKFPKEFGDPAKAQETYNNLSKFVLDHGISAERLEGIYEAGVVEIVQKAYKFDQLQAKAKEVTTPKPNQQNAARTPTRVAPGAAKAANPMGEADRQAIHALRNGERLTPEQLARAFA